MRFLTEYLVRGPIAFDICGSREGAERLVLDTGSALLQFPINLPLIASDS